MGGMKRLMAFVLSTVMMLTPVFSLAEDEGAVSSYFAGEMASTVIGDSYAAGDQINVNAALGLQMNMAVEDKKLAAIASLLDKCEVEMSFYDDFGTVRIGAALKVNGAELLKANGLIMKDGSVQVMTNLTGKLVLVLPAGTFSNGQFSLSAITGEAQETLGEDMKSEDTYSLPKEQLYPMIANNMVSMLINHLLGWVSGTQMETGELYAFDDTYIDATEDRDAVAQRMIGKIEADDFNTLLWYIATSIADAEGDFQMMLADILAQNGVTRAQMRRFTDGLMKEEYMDPQWDWVQPSYYIIEANDGSLCTYDDVSYFFKKLKKCATRLWENPTKNTLGMIVSYDDFGAMVGFDADLKQFSTVVPYEGVFNYSVKTDDYWQTRHTAHGELQWWNDRYITGDLSVKNGEDVDGINESFVKGSIDVLNQKDGKSLGFGTDANMRYQVAVKEGGAESEKFDGSALLSLRENGMGTNMFGAAVSGETVVDDNGFATYATAMIEAPGAVTFVVDMAIEPSVYEEVVFAGGQAVDLSNLDETKTELIKNEVMAQAAKIGLSLIANPSVMSDLMMLISQ